MIGLVLIFYLIVLFNKCWGELSAGGSKLTLATTVAAVETTPEWLNVELLPPFTNSVYSSVEVPKRQKSKKNKMGIPNLIISIIADVGPHGIMPLAYGIAQGDTTGWIAAIVLLISFGSMSAYTMLSYADLAKTTNSRTIGQLWSKLINPKTAWVVDLSIFLLCFGCLIFYSAFIGDIFAALASAVGLRGWLSNRSFVLTAISVFILTPLCLLEDISALKFSSLVGVFGIFYTLAFHILRCFDGTYAPGSPMLQHVAPKMQPTFPEPKLTMWNVHGGTLTLVNMLCVGFLTHYNSISLYEEFDNPTPKRYNTAIGAGFGFAMLLFSSMMFIGYKMFGTAAQPLLLNNFPLTQDPLATFARITTGSAIVFAFPLVFTGLKSCMYGLIYRITHPGQKEASKWNLLSSLLSQTPEKSIRVSKLISTSTKRTSVLTVLTLITMIALQCGEEDVGLVLGIVGSVLGCFAAYVLPGTLKVALMSQRKKAGLTNKKSEVVINHALIAVGVIFGIMGIWITIDSEFKENMEEYMAVYRTAASYNAH
eukprot:CAMPEP_0174967840 /NCGR_PEP_ID=MMETSP0004_2-20121128/7802_1 /TAXON_ID=420556 /ORGANISM="Ochromonas sp., Strain CCMP1393" /LENGTH=537 /DNA_ID=CAMNT_0016217007 /DNA_START=24 /DNA_END=1637 /DNA_ORIENTATION=+